MREARQVIDGSEDLTEAERRFVNAVREGEICDFADGLEITHDDMSTWGAERTVRAAVLRRLLVLPDGAETAKAVRLRGAIIAGVLDIHGARIGHLDLEWCQLVRARADRATFTGDAWFSGATFTGDASFNDATFTGYASFGGATFTGDASFNDATFTGGASFNDAAFTGGASFGDATFTGGASFNDATFTRDASFRGATFTGYASFRGATFAGGASFEGALACHYQLAQAQFGKPDPGPWIADMVSLVGARFCARSRIAITTVALDCSRLQAPEGLHLIVRAGSVDFSDAEFLGRSIVANSTSEPEVPKRVAPKHGPAAVALADELGATLSLERIGRTRIFSLRRAIVGDLVLSGVALEDCAFAGAHGLDELRIDPTCTFGNPPTWPRQTRRPYARRRVLHEEALWRQAHTANTWAVTPDRDREHLDADVPTVSEIAGIYRELRKGLEDAKDEPGAADFYYGEMEMRRLGGRRRKTVADQGRRASRVECRLLDAYWALSGYGLRAWRALVTLAALLLGCAWLFTLPALAHPTAAAEQPSAVDLHTGKILYAAARVVRNRAGFGEALEFTARESLTITRITGSPILTTTRPGTALDIALRLLAPLLLGLALLAVRGRTKR